jgi:hypothetical protein
MERRRNSDTAGLKVVVLPLCPYICLLFFFSLFLLLLFWFSSFAFSPYFFFFFYLFSASVLIGREGR